MQHCGSRSDANWTKCFAAALFPRRRGKPELSSRSEYQLFRRDARALPAGDWDGERGVWMGCAASSPSAAQQDPFASLASLSISNGCARGFPFFVCSVQCVAQRRPAALASSHP
jgi:hypothetical protein